MVRLKANITVIAIVVVAVDDAAMKGERERERDNWCNRQAGE
jgi:hypothetical protein